MLQEDIVEYLWALGVGKGILKGTVKALNIKEKNNKLGLIKTEIKNSLKDTIKKMERQSIQARRKY